MAPNPNRFDRAVMTKRIENRVNEHLRAMLTIENGPGYQQLSDCEPYDAALRLRAAIDREIPEIAAVGGKLGEYLSPDTFIGQADHAWNEHLKRAGPQADRWIVPAADPTSLMLNVIVSLWQQLLFEPQRPNAARMVRGLVAASHSNHEAARPAYELLKRLREITVVPDANGLRRLLGEVIEFLQVFYRPLQVNCPHEDTVAGYNAHASELSGTNVVAIGDLAEKLATKLADKLPQGKPRRKPGGQRKYDPQDDQRKFDRCASMLNQGNSLKEISKELGFSLRELNRLRERVRWKLRKKPRSKSPVKR